MLRRIDIFPAPDDGRGHKHYECHSMTVARLVEKHGTDDAEVLHKDDVDGTPSIFYVHYRNVILDVDGVFYLAAQARNVHNRDTKRNTASDV